MPNSIELQPTDNQDGPIPEHPLASKDIPTFTEQRIAESYGLDPSDVRNFLEIDRQHELSYEAKGLLTEDKRVGLDDYLTFRCQREARKKGEEFLDDPDKLAKFEAGIISDHLTSLLDHGVSADEIISRSPIAAARSTRSFGTLMDRGGNPDLYVEKVGVPNAFVAEDLLKCGADPNGILEASSPDVAIDVLDALVEHGAKVDIDKMTSNAHPLTIVRNLDTLMEHGANIDVNKLASELGPNRTAAHISALTRNGADIDIEQLVDQIEPGKPGLRRGDISTVISLVRHGANIDELFSKLPKGFLGRRDVRRLIDAGVDADTLASKLLEDGVADTLGKRELNLLRKHGASDAILEKLSQ